jgi:hypothetical protein
MSTNQTEVNDDVQGKDKARKADEILKPISVRDLIGPTEELRETSAKREWQIKRLQEKFGVSREITERMVDEGGPL